MSLLHLDLVQLVQAVGYTGIAGIVFAESGLLIGFMLPGDSLLVTAGLLASQGYLSYPVLAALVFIAAVAGDAVGYTLGRRVGRRLFKREGSLLFDPEHLRRAERFYERHGGKAVILARFLPFLRTFAPIVAGIGRMSYPRFAAFNVIGALLWAVGLSFIGYALGSTVPGIDRYILPLVLAIILVSAAPVLWRVLADPRERAKIAGLLRRR